MSLGRKTIRTCSIWLDILWEAGTSGVHSATLASASFSGPMILGSEPAALRNGAYSTVLFLHRNKVAMVGGHSTADHALFANDSIAQSEGMQLG